jgi:two-component system sensor histidine kinase BarA
MSLSRDITDVAHLDHVVDRDSVVEVCRSFFELFGLPVRVVSATGQLLADVHVEREVCRYVNTLSEGARACASTVEGARTSATPGRTQIHPCFTGAAYRIGKLEHDGRELGRVIVGPYLPAELEEVPKSLLVVDPGIDGKRALTALQQMPRVRETTAERLVKHLQHVLELLAFSGHKAWITSELHLLSVRESFRELAVKNATLEKAYGDLQELDRLKSDFLATVSHELRAPLTAILGYSDMLKSGFAGPLNDEQREYAETIHRRGELLLELISNLLDVGKLEQGRMKMRFAPFPPKALCDEVRATLRVAADKKNVRLVFDPPPPMDAFCADGARLRQVLTNLLDNAIKFSPRGGEVTLSLDERAVVDGAAASIFLAAPERRIRFTVRDTGIGIHEDQHERVFEAFYQVDGSTTREYGGTGLGLAIVKKIVEAHRGTVSIESRLGEGTTFLVEIPEAAPSDE